MFSAMDYVLPQPTCVPDKHSGDYPDDTALTPVSPAGPVTPVSLVLNLLMAPREQRRSIPPPVPIGHPAVAVIVDHGHNRRVIERGGATVQAVQDFLSDQLCLPTTYLPAEMVREPYFDGDHFNEVSYSEIVTAMATSSCPWDEAVSSCPWDEPGTRLVLGDRLQLAVYEVEAGRLIAPEAAVHLPYC